MPEGEQSVMGGASPAPSTQPAAGEPSKAQLAAWTHQVPADLIDEDMHGKEKLADYVRLSRERRDKLKTTEERMKSALFKPGKDAKPEEIAAWRAARGVPDSPDAYKFEGVKILDEEGAKAFRELAAKAELSVEQAQAIASFEAERARARDAKAVETRDRMYNETISAVKAQYPSEWEAKIAHGNRIATQFFGEEGMAKLASSSLGNEPWFVKGMIELAKNFTEGGVPAGSQAPSITGDGMSLDERYPSMKNFKA